MQVCATIAEARDALRHVERPLGAVLTMGALHDGHLALIRRARAECKTVAVTIYVNPTQFGNAGDLDTYPRPMQDDLRALRREGVDVVLVPSNHEIYPEGFDSWVEPGHIATRLEGEHRPGHFRGVCTVVLKLFNILGPDRSYFGEKDAQQVLVIHNMVNHLALPVDIVTVPTVRERDGLAMSSRNANLSTEERRTARSLYQALTRAQDLVAEGERNAETLRHAIQETLTQEPLANIDYISIADPQTLTELTTLTAPALASLAVRVGQTRLIDNITLQT